MRGLTLCGCGWLGGYLARRNTFDVPLLGTSRSLEKLADLPVTGHAFSLGQDSGPLAAASRTNPVVLNIAPGARKKPLAPTFASDMQALADDFIARGCPQLIFISTTAVFGDQEGVLTADAPLAPQTESAIAHAQIERYLLQTYPDKALVIRLAGLVGPDRHPVTSLAGRSLTKGEQVVNLVHVDDVCAGIESALKQRLTGEVLQLCSLTHPRRADYYTWCAQQRQLTAPQFNADYTNKNASGKHIDAKASWRRLKHELSFPSPEAMC